VGDYSNPQAEIIGFVINANPIKEING